MIEETKFYLTAHFDGACEPENPGGNMGIGAYIVDNETGETIFELSDMIPASAENTNNIAEYLAIMMVLTFLHNYEPANGKRIMVCGDSMLVINQMSGKWKAKKGSYLDTRGRAIELQKQLLTKSCELHFKWIPRGENSRADELSKQALLKHKVQIRNRG